MIWKSLDGDGGGGDFNGTEDFLLDPHVTPLREALILLGQGSWVRGLPVGGSNVIGVECNTSGDKDLVDWVPVEIDNSGDRLSDASLTNGAVRIVQFRYRIRVSDTGITVTPKIVYGSTLSFGTTATISGQSACSATDEDFLGDASQYQAVAVLLPSSFKIWKAMFTVGGTPAPNAQAWVTVWHDRYIAP